MPKRIRPRHLQGVLLATLAIVGASGVVTASATASIAVDCSTDQAALQPAIDAAAAGSTLTVSGKCVGSFTIAKDLALVAAPANSGKLVSRSRVDPTLTVLSGTVSVQGFKITNPRSPWCTFGCPEYGVVNHGSLTLSRSSVSHNPVGGIHNLSSLVLLRSSVKGNGFVVQGDGFGGVVSEAGSSLTMTETTVASNGGGGVINFGDASIERSTISDNLTDVVEGAGISTSGSMTVVDSTIANNSAHDVEDGDQIVGSNLTIVRSTISGGGGTLIWGDPSVTLIATILDGGCTEDEGAYTSGGYNVATGDTLSPCHLSQPTDLTGVDPLLGLLTTQGGPTQTMALDPGSPAIDRIQVGVMSSDGLWELCPLSGSTDQRGVPRPQGAACDVGAFEAKS